MDYQQYEAWCKQFTGPCGHHWSKECYASCHNPCTPWNDRPTGHCNPPPMNFAPPPLPCPPPAPPIPGESPMECMNKLYAQACASLKQCGELNAKTEHLLHDLHEYGLRNGAYYDNDVIKVEDGYSAEDSAPYTIITIKPKDKYGCPVKFNLHLAYGNTTNSGIKQAITDASLFELAQIMVPAVDGDKWHGYVTYQGAPLPSDQTQPKYTYGFTAHGKLKVYKDSFISENPSILNRDTIVTSMGTDGLLIRNGEAAVGEDIAGIANYGEQASRVILGQNYNTHETFIMCVGNWGEDYPGMTCANCVTVLKGYGCSVAVLLSTGNSSAVLNKGAYVFPPYDNKAPESAAFLYVSKKSSFKNELQFNLAYLTQLMNQLSYSGSLTDKSLTELADKVTQEIDDRAAGDAALKVELATEKQKREEADQQLRDDLEAEADARTEADSDLTQSITEEREAREAADSEIKQSLSDEASERAKQDADIRSALKDEATTRANQDALLDNKITAENERALAAENTLTDSVNQLNSTVTTLTDNLNNLNTEFNTTKDLLTKQLATLSGDVDNLQILYGDIQKQLTALDNALTQTLSTINDVETGMNGIKENMATLTGDMSDLKDTVRDQNTKIDELESQVNGLDTKVSEMDEKVNRLADLTPITDSEIQTEWEG